MRKNSATPKAISTARISIERRCAGISSLVRATYIGTTPGGSTTTSRVTKAANPNLKKSWSMYGNIRVELAICRVYQNLHPQISQITQIRRDGSAGGSRQGQDLGSRFLPAASCPVFASA